MSGTERGLVASAIVAGYGDMEILHGVSLRAEPGEVVTIIGPNGSGKSTLLKVLAGLVRPWSGAIHVGGEAVSTSSARQRLESGVAYVPQVEGVFTNLTVLENLQMGIFLWPQREREEIERAFADFPVLAEKRGQRAGKLSGGQRQMVAIARALMARPSVLILDEPSCGLSPKVMDEVFERVRAIANGSVAVILVEQNAHKALALCDRAYVMADGVVKLEGTRAELLVSPQVNAIYLGGAVREGTDTAKSMK